MYEFFKKDENEAFVPSSILNGRQVGTLDEMFHRREIENELFLTGRKTGNVYRIVGGDVIGTFKKIEKKSREAAIAAVIEMEDQV